MPKDRVRPPLRDAGPRPIVLRGRLGGRDVAYEHVATFAAGEAADFLPRLWAHRKVAFLLDAIRLNGKDKELTDEIVRLAKRFAVGERVVFVHGATAFDVVPAK